MKLLTGALEKRFAEIGSQENEKDPIFIAKFFHPVVGFYWFASEYDPKTKTFFGYASLFHDENDEYGYFSLEELESVKKFGLGVERDLHFKETRSSEVIKNLKNM